MSNFSIIRKKCFVSQFSLKNICVSVWGLRDAKNLILVDAESRITDYKSPSKQDDKVNQQIIIKNCVTKTEYAVICYWAKALLNLRC